MLDTLSLRVAEGRGVTARGVAVVLGRGRGLTGTMAAGDQYLVRDSVQYSVANCCFLFSKELSEAFRLMNTAFSLESTALLI